MLIQRTNTNQYLAVPLCYRCGRAWNGISSMVANNSTETMTGTYSVNDKIITLNRSNGDNVQATILSVNETTLVLTYDPNNPNIALTYVK